MAILGNEKWEKNHTWDNKRGYALPPPLTVRILFNSDESNRLSYIVGLKKESKSFDVVLLRLYA